ncbi:hypothetical protein B0H16DRAFT_1481901 [Mycena metata]|uniref:Uncharacterized protein n=1 Tax=Mycena metata TaxID=1033252 RepID=A0AAD7GW60_9AGAR|nr:hypothetical protein B0H16DRAFT_1481901 [Mycena metata]
MDINILEINIDQYKDAIEGPKTYDIAALGWTPPSVLENHKDYVGEEVAAAPDDCVAVVVIASDFVDRTRASDAVKAILRAELVPDADKIGSFPAIPKVGGTADNNLQIMPFTQIITNCTAAFKLRLAADPVLHGVHEGAPTSFYCIPARPPTPFIFTVFVGFTADAPDQNVKAALFTTLIGRPDFLQMVNEDHSNIPRELKPEIVLAVAIHWGTVSKCTVYRGGRQSLSLTAHRIMFPPISKDPAMNQRLQNYIMSPDFFVDARQFGEGRPWYKGPAKSPKYMGCDQCHGIDHYKEFCPIATSKRFLEIHGLAEPDTNLSSIPTSLLAAQELPSEWTSVNYRGRGRGRGGPRGHYRGDNGYNGGQYSGYNSGYNGGYNGGGRGRGGGSSSRGYTYKPYF